MVCLVEYVHLLNAAHIVQVHYYYTAIRYKHVKQQIDKLCEIVRLTGSQNANTKSNIVISLLTMKVTCIQSWNLVFVVLCVGAAMVVIYPQDTVVMPVKTALLVCVAYGDPQSSVTWSKGTVSLSNSSQTSIWQQLLNQSGFVFVRSVLEICNTNAAHSGEYSCTADNGVGSHSISFQLTIQGKQVVMSASF